jgi:hypothetical protein
MDCYAQYKNNSIYSWDGVRAAIADGTYKDVYKVGDLVPLDLGSYGVHNMEIVAFDADEKTDGSKAAITWLSKELIARHGMNPSGNVNGWAASVMRTWLQSDIYNALPSEVRGAIVTVSKTYYDFTTKSTLTCEDNVWIPSVGEIFGNNSDSSGCENSGVEYTTYFADDTSRIKHHSGTATTWWLRSTVNYNSTFFRMVLENGRINITNVIPETGNGVALGFCT